MYPEMECRMSKKFFVRSLAICCFGVGIFTLANAIAIYNEAAVRYGEDHVPFLTTIRVVAEVMISGVAICYGLVLRRRH